MSEHVDKRWHTDTRDLAIFSEDGTAIVRVCENSVECCRMVDDHNACLGIKDPVRTVPELVARLADLLLVIAADELIPESASYMVDARAALAETERGGETR